MNIPAQYRISISMACLAVTIAIPTAQLYAGNAIQRSIAQPQNTSIISEPNQKPSTGKFFGYDQATRKIWIDDFVYLLSTGYKVIGSSTKLGLLSAIKYQEVVAFKTAPNPTRPSVPYIVEIRRK